TPQEIIKNINPAILIIDFNPILKRDYLKNADFKIYEIDGHNIIPARFVSSKQEYSAVTLRTKIYYNIYPFLTEFMNLTSDKVEADNVLEDFIKNKLQYYSENKNDPSVNVISSLSKYLNLGFISSQRVALEVIKSGLKDTNKEAFLEELIIRKELADNFCLYSESFKDFSSIPNWAKMSLDNHKYDIRPYTYSLEILEKANTHDKLWNATQTQLIKEGTIHGYLRMYWAKKILEWMLTPEDALKTAIYLNDKYAYDAPSANGYVGILWAIGGLHDRAFADYPVTGKIRRMTYDSMKRKYDLSNYIKKYTKI
ncbi:deoxyribodipyrimidine photolyase, partial [bacterium]|nr:deoxyribodipyrimidine photolyase [bacterium]